MSAKPRFQRGTVGVGLQCADATAARGAGGPEPQQFAQLVELENVLCRSRHFRQCFFICAAKKFAASSGVVAEWMRLPLASFQTRDSDEARGPQFHFTHAIEDGLPEIANDGDGLGRNHGFVQHFPNDGEFDQCTGATLAGHKTVGEANQFKEALFPGFHTNFDVDEGIGVTRKEFRGYAVSLSVGFFGAARNRFHDSAVSAAADGEAMLGQQAAHLAGFAVVRVSFRRAGTTKDGDDALFVHGDGCPCGVDGVGLAAAGGASNSWIIASHNASSASCVS